MTIATLINRARTHRREPCAVASRARNEDTAGTLGYFDIGMFVEGTKPFPRLALKSIAPMLHQLNIEAWQRFQETGKGLHPRILPIRRDRRNQSNSLNVFFSIPSHTGPNLQLRFDFSDHEDLIDFDLVELRDHPERYLDHRDDTFRLLICTHGKVDPCCAVDGNAIYRLLRDRKDLELWHAAHFGGCRFAANVWCLPSGNCYGHVSAETIDELIEAERQKRIYPRGYRGRIGQPMHAAAAEYLVRKREDSWEFDDLRIEMRMVAAATGEFTVHTRSGTQHGRLAPTHNLESFYTTCRSLEPSSPPKYRLDSINISP